MWVSSLKFGNFKLKKPNIAVMYICIFQMFNLKNQISTSI